MKFLCVAIKAKVDGWGNPPSGGAVPLPENWVIGLCLSFYVGLAHRHGGDLKPESIPLA